MLQSIRDRTQGWFAGIIVSILILSFALWGIHSYFTGGASNNVVAKVDGVEISKSQLTATYERLRRQLQTQFNNASPALSDKIESGLKKQALETLITTQVLKQASLAQEYRISSNQIDNYLEGIPDFRVNGEFSFERFQKILANTLLSVPEFLELLKTSLLIDQPRLGMIFTSFALPNEVSDTYAIVGQERNIQYALFSFDQMPKSTISISEEKIQSYYKQHEDEFRTPEQVSVAYIQLSESDVSSKIQPSDDELKSFYNDNAGSYNQPFEKIKSKVKDSYVRQQAEEKFADEKEKLANLTYEHPDTLETAAKQLGLSVKKSESFTQEKGGKDISANPKVRSIAFSNEVLAQQNNSDVIQLSPNIMLVLRINSHVPATLLPLSAVRNQIEQRLITAEVQVQTKVLADDIANKLRSQPLSQITQQYHLKWNDLGVIGRHSNKVDSAILNAAFAMPKPDNQKSNFAIAKVPQGYAVVMLNDVKVANVTAASHDQYVVFAEQFQNSQGLLEYELYKRSQIQRAKVVIGLS